MNEMKALSSTVRHDKTSTNRACESRNLLLQKTKVIVLWSCLYNASK